MGKKKNRDDYLVYICEVICKEETFVPTRYNKIVRFLEDVIKDLTTSDIIKSEIKVLFDRYVEQHRTRFEILRK